jgi:hypothetical protein
VRLFLIASLIAGVIACIALAVPTQIFGLVSLFWVALCLTLFVADFVFGGWVIPISQRQNPPQ